MPKASLKSYAALSTTALPIETPNTRSFFRNVSVLEQVVGDIERVGRECHELSVLNPTFKDKYAAQFGELAAKLFEGAKKPSKEAA